jgi:hypothetical protein
MVMDGLGNIMLQLPSIGPDIQAQNLARLAIHDDFDGAAADFAIGGEPLRGLGGVDDDLELLATIRALDGCRLLHPGLLHPETEGNEEFLAGPAGGPGRSRR